MNTLKNWIATALLILGAIADLGFDTLSELGLNSKQILLIRCVVTIGGFVYLKLQTPTTNPARLRKMVRKAEDKRKE